MNFEKVEETQRIVTGEWSSQAYNLRRKGFMIKQTSKLIKF